MSRAVTVETFASLAARIQSLPTSTAPRLVAIDGPSGAGKSTFARRLGRALGDPPIVAMDDFVSWDNLVSLATGMGPPRCQQQGTTFGS
jgi:pantothenate kinase-related protein Tda10